MKTRSLVIGYGNPLRGDDGLGWEVVGRLAASIPDRSVGIMAVHQLTPELAEPVSNTELAIFVDASYEGKPGTWKCDEVEPAPPTSNALGHHFNVSGLLNYAQALFNSSPRAYVISVAAETFECHEDLSRAVEAALPEIIHHIREKIDALSPKPEAAYA